VQLLVRADNTVGILNITDYNDLGFDFWYEAIDACTSTYGKWTPAQYQGRPVNAALDVSLAFSPQAAACQTVVTQYERASALAEEGATLYNEEKTEEGLAKMSEALALFPRDGKLLLLRGQAYLDLNRIDEACKDLKLARSITLVDWYNGVLQLCR
jgi:tetratricopeptide (TPR) repeat protein